MSAEDADALEEATQLYTGDFLTGFRPRNAPDFEVWQLAQQARLREMMVRALQALSDRLIAKAENQRATEATRRIVMLEPWREEAHRQLMALLAQSGDRSAALTQYDQCVKALKIELDVVPSEETDELYEQILSGAFPPPDARRETERRATETRASTQRVTLPIPATRFVGRQQVLSDLCLLLRRDDVRLVTLTGVGGVGKTRLAIQSGSTLAAEFPDGVAYVDLVPIQSSTLVPVAIADVLGVRESAGNRPLVDHIIGHLCDKELLLIIDNLEHVIGAAPFVAMLLSKAPHVKALVTSRMEYAWSAVKSRTG